MNLPKWGSVEWAREHNESYGRTYTFEANGFSPCHLPSLTHNDEDFDFACDMHQPCAGTLEEMRAQARKWKTRFPQHEVVVYSRTCLDAQGKWDEDDISDEFFVEEVK